jgi:hypothetical protein
MIAAYQEVFPLHQEVEIDDFVHNREVYRFGVRWAQEEDAHAHILQTYQLRAGLASPDELRRDLAIEGRKVFSLKHLQPVQFFTYTLVQEKATQIYYQKLSQVIDEPVLKSILQQLVRDEARHFAFFSKVVETYIQKFGAAVIPLLKDTSIPCAPWGPGLVPGETKTSATARRKAAARSAQTRFAAVVLVVFNREANARQSSGIARL